MKKNKKLLIIQLFLPLITITILTPSFYSCSKINKHNDDPKPIKPEIKNSVVVTVNKITKFTFFAWYNKNVPNLKYRNCNNGIWKTIYKNDSFYLTANNVYEFRGLNKYGFYNEQLGVQSSLIFSNNFNNDQNDEGDISISGDIMALIDDGSGTTTIPENSSFRNLFYKSYALKKISSDFLTPMKLTKDCYKNMFAYTSLVKTPNLLATDLAAGCYSYMFFDCQSLLEAPKILPAMKLADNCYESMFACCESLGNAPELPAITLADHCYEKMFCLCYMLKKVPQLPATTLCNYCYSFMFLQCTSLETTGILPARKLAEGCYNNMFELCENLKNTPNLLASEVPDNAYNSMFMYCPNIIETGQIQCSIAGNKAFYCMFAYCDSLKSGPNIFLDDSIVLGHLAFGETFYECKNLQSIKFNYNGNFINTIFTDWMYKVNEQGTFYYNGKDLTTGSSGIPTGWTISDIR